jgi:hypothetical protein
LEGHTVEVLDALCRKLKAYDQQSGKMFQMTNNRNYLKEGAMDLTL